ncbi:HIT family protein [Pontibacter korlensis]|uniref:Diadenosine tetraphosphate hydrolase n=1 Tax=Pontibacter korlensis TaxID=400092 RepID=A0A0E3ZIZ0_9BACT|nr:HIT family protein [Pontibacter korlensis]AKD04930.1 diadenosine tetraphosphate hydrolase [Pontibacter korlensis]
MSVFSKIPEDRVIYRGKSFFLIRDAFPVSPGHTLIISNEEKTDFFQLDEDERGELTELIITARKLIERELSPDGYNIGMNCGETAGQTVMHFHCHVIPRYSGDMENPRGGIRHCISGKGYY